MPMCVHIWHVYVRGRVREGAFSVATWSPGIIRPPNVLFLAVCAHRCMWTRDKQSHEVPLEAQMACTYLVGITLRENAAWSLFCPLDGCNNIWASCQGQGFYGNRQTVE